MAPSTKQSKAAKKKDDENNKLMAEMKARMDAMEEENRQKNAQFEAQLNERNAIIEQQKVEFEARLAISEKQKTATSTIVSDGAQANTHSRSSTASMGEDGTAVAASIDTVNTVGKGLQNELLDSSDSSIDMNGSGGAGGGEGNGNAHDGEESNLEEPMDEEFSEGELVGNDHYSVNMTSAYGAAICRKTGRLDFDLFDFEVEKWNECNRPQTVLSVIKSSAFNNRNEPIGGVKRDFHTKIEKFSDEIFTRLGDIYPYLVPDQVVLPLCSRFFQLYDKQKELNSFFTKYKDDFPGAQYTKPTKVLPVPVNCSELLFRKLDNLFYMRSTRVKQANVWPFKQINDRSTKKYDPIALNKVETKFKYKVWKAKLEQRMDGKRSANQQVLAKRSEAKRIEAARVEAARLEAARLQSMESQPSETAPLQSMNQAN